MKNYGYLSDFQNPYRITKHLPSVPIYSAKAPKWLSNLIAGHLAFPLIPLALLS